MPPRRVDSENSPPEALKRFLKRVLREHAALRDSLAPDPVHDLRVALRRCRTLAEGFATIDDHRGWKRMRKTAKKLQDGLGGLRDTQVMSERVRQLRIGDSPAGLLVSERLRRDESEGKRNARRALEKFPRKRWKRWGERLPKRAQRLQTSPEMFAGLVLESIQEVAAKERRWRSGESQAAAHRLRIAVKHFRYTLQSFLPKLYTAWAKDLQSMQDTLGEIHDLDVLRAWLLQGAAEESLDRATVRQWLRRIAGARRSGVGRYKKAVAPEKAIRSGKHAALLWDRWLREIERLADAQPK